MASVVSRQQLWRGRPSVDEVERGNGAQEIVTTDDPMGPMDLVYPAGAIALRASFPNTVEFFSVHDLDLRPYNLHRGGATHDNLLHANLPKTVLRGKWTICALPASTSMMGCPCKRKFAWIRWCTPLVLLTLLPSLSTQRRHYQVGERGQTHVFNVLAVSLVRGSARLWPCDYLVIHCVPGSGWLLDSSWLWSARGLTVLRTPCHVVSGHSRVVELTCSGLMEEKDNGSSNIGNR